MASKTGSTQIQQAVEKADWELLFEFLDKDKSGEISYVEFVTRVDDLGEVTDFQDLQEAMKMFRDGDDGDKKLTKAEFAKMMGVKFTEIKVMSAFSGDIFKNDNFFQKQKTKTAINDKNWGEMFDFIDCNKNGSISIVEFMTTMDDLGEADDYGK